MAKRKRTNKHIQNIKQTTKHRAMRSLLKTGSELRCSGRVGSSCSISDTRCVTLMLVKAFRFDVYDETKHAWSIYDDGSSISTVNHLSYVPLDCVICLFG
jgi:hypothetical protein